MNKSSIKAKFMKSNIGKYAWSVLHTLNLITNRRLSDVEYFGKSYKRIHKKNINFDNPKTFDEKQLWIKCFYRNPIYTLCSDKYQVREYVKKRGLEHILSTVYGAYSNPEDIEWDKLPNCFYMKANHASGYNLRCNDLKTFDKDYAVRYFKKALKKNYYYESREWNYKDIERKVIIEEIIESKSGEELVDYRFLCYDGKCEYIFIDIGTAGESGRHLPDAKRNVYDRDMNLLDVKVSRERFDPSLVSKPKEFDEMREYAETLSKDLPFCRVDLYNVDGRVIFGEITFFHAGGLSLITPEEWEYKLAEHIDIDKLKESMKK